MTRINTNISSLTAQNTLSSSNASLQQTLTRLSTGLRINSGKDDPAGLIAANELGNDIKSSQQAIANSQVANQLISTADSALGQISSLLTDVKGLVNQASNTAVLSASQIAANQLQIDSSLDAINRISQTTNFQGQKLLDGSLGFIVGKDTGFGKVQDLQVNQANFGTQSSVAIDIKVTGLAKQAQVGATVNDGVSSDVKATAHLSFADASSLTIQASSTGTTSNGIRIKFTESGTIGAGNGSAAFDSSSQTLNITVANTGTTTATTIANAITSGTDFTVTAHSTGATGFVHGTDSPTLATNTISTGDAGNLTVTSLIPGANTANVLFVLGDATGGPTVSVDSSNNLSITVNDSKHNGGVTTLASISAAINAYKDTSGRQVYSSNVNVAGTVNTAVNATTRLAADGTAVAAKVDSSTALAIANGPTITFKALGAAATGARIVFSKGGAGSESAVYDSTANGGKGQLTVNLDDVFGGGALNGTYSKADLLFLINGATATSGPNPFKALVAGDISTASIDTTLVGVLPTSAVATVVTGTDGALNAVNGALAGGGIGGQFGIGGGTTAGTGTSGLAADLTLQIGGNSGSQILSFGKGTTAAQVASALNQISDSTGVSASTEGDQLVIKSTDYGSAAFVNVKIVSEGTGGAFGSTLSGTHGNGSDISATVNNVAATGTANTVSFNTSSLAFSAALDPTKVSLGDDIKFNLNGGGALFQLGPDVQSSEQARLGIQSVDTSTLGGTVGRLFELGSGKDASLVNNTKLAGKIISSAINTVDSLRGRLGAFQKSTLDTNIATLTNTVTNLTAAQSSIQDADFAAESANLTRAQILVQSGTSVLSIANKNPENVLSLLR